MDSECPTPNVQPTLDDGATPSAEACDQRAATARDRKLARDRARRRERLASETAEEKERRLSQRRVRDRARRRPSAHSEKHLEQMRSTERQRRAVESQDQRETRLTRNRLSQQQRLEAETLEERAARLQHLRARKQERIASETAEETAARRQRDREAHSRQPPAASAQPLLHQPAVQARMRKFHSQLASLEASTCTTCLERFPGMTIRHTAAGTVCIRCHRDTHSPKAYSRENNSSLTFSVT